MNSRASGAIGGAAQGAATGAQIGGPWGAVVGGVAGGLMGALGGGGEDDAMKLAERQAKIMLSVARENERRAQREKDRNVGAATAAIGASNVQFSGSSNRYRRALETEYSRTIKHDREIAEKSARNVIAGGQAAADSISNAALGSMVSSIGSLGAAYAGGAFDTGGNDPGGWDTGGATGKNDDWIYTG